MKPNQLHETDISFFTGMPLEEAVKHLDGKVIFFNSLGFDVAYAKKSAHSISAVVSDHYVHADPRKYVIHLVPKTTGQQIFDQTYVALNSYIAKARLHEEPKSG